MHDLYELKKMLIDLLDEYSKKRDLSSSSLQTVDTLAHACKNVCKIIEFCESEESGMSRAMDRSYYEGSYDDGMSHRRGRAANGRFVSRDGSEMSRKLYEMMENAPDDATKHELRRLADRLGSM